MLYILGGTDTEAFEFARNDKKVSVFKVIRGIHDVRNRRISKVLRVGSFADRGDLDEIMDALGNAEIIDV